MAEGVDQKHAPGAERDLMQEAGVFPEEKLRDIIHEAKELVSIFVASVRTAKGFTSSIVLF